MQTQTEKAIAFQALHQRAGAFIIPNPYDIGTARLLASLGFEALATTSAGCAFALGQRDYTLTREQVLKHVAEISAATDLPVSADLEGGFGDDPETVARLEQQFEQGNGIRAAADRYGHALTGVQEVLGLEGQVHDPAIFPVV